VTAATGGIRRLAPAVADAIAAGEVVERPASVVKELCENALDAGARHIEVDVDGGGLTRVAVADDGSGIDADELTLAVSRHATSKIESRRDLERIGTLGFRGEALASIAAVSELRIVSRPAGRDAAATIRVRSGEPLGSGAAARAPGTTVEVCDLFTATPARLRFMREPRSEAALATRMVADLALTRPAVAFACTVDSRTSVRTDGRDLAGAVRAVFGAESAGRMVAVDATGDVAVSGLVSDPLVHRGNRAGLVLVVNGRRIHNRSLLVAVEEAYSGLLPAQRHPFGVVEVCLDPERVDVNVHPTKREVRFRDERAVFAAVQRACWSALRAQPLRATPAWAPGSGGAAYAPLRSPARGAGAFALGLAEAPPDSDASGPERTGSASKPGLGSLRALGQVRGEWILAEREQGFAVVDPHAAHERVLYARLLEQWTASRGAGGGSQLLLLPVLVACDPERLARFERSADLLARCGFEVALFGPGELRCTAVPTSATGADVAALVVGILDGMEPGTAEEARLHRVAALVACHAAVRFGDRIAPEQQQRLLEDLAATPGSSTCPHGRPTVLAIDEEHLRRAFRRPL
jgi:DNA mismatch repair protein MutL